MYKVEIYSTPTCHYCHMAKDLLTALGQEFSDYNVNQDADKRQEFLESGARGVPLIKITNTEGEVEMLPGFDEERLRELFANK